MRPNRSTLCSNASNAPVLAGVFRVDPLGKFLMLCPCNTVFHLRHLFPQAFGTDCSRFPYVVVRQAFPSLSVVGHFVTFGISVGAARLFPFGNHRRIWNQHLCPQRRRYIRRPAFLRRVRCQAFIQNIRVPAPGRPFRRYCWDPIVQMQKLPLPRLHLVHTVQAARWTL